MYSLLHSTILGTLQATGLLLVLAVGYIIYLRYFHPLAEYPGPFWASVTNFRKAYHYWTLKLPQTMVKLHEEYGSIVRVGLNDLDFDGAEAVAPIYKSGRQMPKSVFYDAFTAIKPNIFGARDEQAGSPRYSFNKSSS
jgi:hypothetical protein